MSEGSSAGRRARWALLLVLVLQLVLAVAAAHGRVLLDDEVGTWRAVRGSWGAIATHFDEWQTQPAYFLLAKAASVLLAPFGLGTTEHAVGAVALRLPALLAGLGLTWAVHALARRLLSERAALFAAALVGLHPYVLFYSQMARGYTLAMALATASLLLVHRVAAGEGGRWSGPLLVLARAGSVYAHLGACATVVAEVVLAAGTVRRRERPRAALVRTLAWVTAGGVLALLLYGPMLPGMLAFRRRWTGESQGGFSLGFLPLVARTYGGGTLAGLVLLGAAALAGLAALAMRRRWSAAVLAAWVLAVPLFYAALGTAHYPWAFARFLTPVLPALALLAAEGLARAAARLGPRVAWAPLVVVLLAAYRDDAAIAFGPRDVQWPRLLAELAREGPRLVVTVPVRFQAVEPYRASLAAPDVTAMRVEELPARLARVGPGLLVARPLTFLVDVVPVDALAAEGAFRVEHAGSTTRLDLTTPPGDAHVAVAAVRSLADAIIAFLEPYEGRPIAGHWVFWRLDARHEHPWSATRTLVAAYALRGVTLQLEGDAAGARAAAERARALQASEPEPGAVRSRL